MIEPTKTLKIVAESARPAYGVCPHCKGKLALTPSRLRVADTSIRTPRDVAALLQLQMGQLEREEMRVLLLNSKNVIVRQRTVYVGNVSAALVRVGELFTEAIRTNAAGVILVHNHPSGQPEPSPDDLHLTAEAIAAGRLLDIPVLDHLVIASSSYVSLRDRGVGFDSHGGRR